MPKALLDHVIILVPSSIIDSPPEWLTKHFTITQGGTHADGKTHNSLIVFQDGSYIELIAFVDGMLCYNSCFDDNSSSSTTYAAIQIPDHQKHAD